MVTYEENDDLHEKLKAADKAFRRATDQLEANRFEYRDDPSDRNRIKVWQAQVKLNEATEVREELLDEIAEEQSC